MNAQQFGLLKMDNTGSKAIIRKIKTQTAMSDKDKIKKAKDIIAEISNLTHYHDDGYTPKGYGNWELNKAVDAMYGYIKTIQEEPNKVKS